jgi:hypothetical protein
MQARQRAASNLMSGCECKRDSAQPEIKGIRPILKQLRTLAGFLFFSWLPASTGGKTIESLENQKCRRSFKSSAENSEQLEKIENCGRKFKSSAERWAFRRKFETAAEQLKSSAEKLNLSLKICNVRGKFASPAGARASPAKI